MKLKIPDQELRNQIDADRISLGLEPLKPSAQKNHFLQALKNRHRPIEDPVSRLGTRSDFGGFN